MTPIKYNVIQEFEGNIHNTIIHDKNLYLILRETCSILNNILKNIPITNENEFIQNFIDAIFMYFLVKYMVLENIKNL